MKLRDTRPRLKRRVIHKGNRVTLISDEVMIAGKKRMRDWIKRPRVAAMVCEDKKGLWLVRQYRHGINRTLWEIPAGTVDAKETPLQCARRECREEIGKKAGKIVSLGKFITAPAEVDDAVYLYLAKDLSDDALPCDEDEEITLRLFSKSKVRQMLKSGVIQDAKSIIGLQRYFNL